MKSITIAVARNSDLPALLALLEQSGLPQEGLADHLATTIVARSGDAVVGSAALEVYGEAALLRSVAVHSGLRGQGLGQRLTRTALDVARQHGIATVYLLTETAGNFFPRFGFRPTERAAVEPAVQQSVEFKGACPASAQVLVASLSSA
jgi:N-acetylglutamate synthase-like GNAT family acetyltransferase